MTQQTELVAGKKRIAEMPGGLLSKWEYQHQQVDCLHTWYYWLRLINCSRHNL